MGIKTIEIVFLVDHYEGTNLHFKKGQKVKVEKKGAKDFIARGIAKEIIKNPYKMIELKILFWNLY